MRRLFMVVCMVCLVTYNLPLVGAQDGGTATHVVQLNENLYRIALRYNVSLTDLMRANNILDSNLIIVGQVLVIPGVMPATAAPVAPPDDPVVARIAADPPDRAVLPAGAIIEETQAEEVSTSQRDSSPPETPLQPDLGILSPNAANWMLQPGIMLTGTARTVRQIYRHGQALGRNPHAFSKIGDCNSEMPFFLAKFDRGEYNLGPYTDLQAVIDQFAGSFERQSMAVWTGNHAWAVLDATWANPAFCQPGETPLACEFRLHNPSMVLIRLGTNEAGDFALFENSMRQIIDFAIEQGVIPVLGTKADRLEGSDHQNEIVRALAAEYGVPLWDFGRIADTLPARGLQADGIHLTYVPPDYTAPAALQNGHPVQNLIALMVLNTVWRNAMY